MRHASGGYGRRGHVLGGGDGSGPDNGPHVVRPGEGLRVRTFLSGAVSEDEAIALTQRYQLSSPERAAQTIDFAKTYRSYIINYGLGLDMVRAHVEAAGPSPDARWARMREILSTPTLPSDLTG